MTHSKKFNTVKKWYERGLWTKDMVHNAVVKKWITADEYKELTGDDYIAE